MELKRFLLEKRRKRTQRHNVINLAKCCMFRVETCNLQMRTSVLHMDKINEAGRGSMWWGETWAWSARNPLRAASPLVHDDSSKWEMQWQFQLTILDKMT